MHFGFVDRNPCFVALFWLTTGIKQLLETVEPNPKIVPVDSKFSANFAFVPIFDENRPQDVAVSLRQLPEKIVNSIVRLQACGCFLSGAGIRRCPLRTWFRAPSI
jgi:hypothetical protein